ncbi:hypothetical protein CFC21_082434 [Triticum aestivum]|uniref:Proline-rich protein n=2 Tax=Triticum aestivum TaxID=4565 RepID=A0A3B6NK27_WHEAT|nr:hypothetical protein CFC21_082434 [Triticum aestivum]
MGALPRGLLVLGVCAVLVAAVLADASPASSMVVGLAKCADCTRKNMKAEAAFTGLQVAVKCKNAHGEYETKAVGAVDKSGAFGVPLGADLLREDGELKQDCFAQLHSAPDHPCPGQEPSMIVRQSANGAEKNGFVAVPGEVHYSSQECASAFLCHFFHKKHLFHKKPALVVPHLNKKAIVIPHIHKKPKPVPVPEYKPPTPTPVYTHPTPVPEHKPPTPVYTHPTLIYHPPADQKMAQDPETDPQLFKKLLPFIKKNPFFKKFPPAKEDTKP